MPHFEKELSPLYQEVKENLEVIKKPYINYEEYETICQKVATNQASQFNISSQTILADFLNDLGIMLNFKKAHQNLEELYIFQPQWIVNGVYQIINAGEAQKQKGKIQENTVTELLKKIDYGKTQERRFIIEMMKHFKLLFEQNIFNQCHYLIPSLFDKNRPKNIEQYWQVESPLKIRFEYDIWRNDYISYFLVSQHKHIQANQYWINGGILKYNEQKVLIEAVRREKSIYISIEGKGDRRYAFWRIREALEDVHEMFDKEKLGIKLWVIYEKEEKRQDFSYNRLQKMLKKGIPNDYSEVFDDYVNVADLLHQVALSPQEIPMVIKSALKHLEEANTNLCFDEMDKINISGDSKPTYKRLKKEFIHSGDTFGFKERLEVCIKEIAQDYSP